MRCLLCIEPQAARSSSRDRVRTLGDVVEAVGAHGSDIGEPALDLVRKGKGRKEVATAAVHILGRS